MRGKTIWNMLWEVLSPILLYILLSVILTGILEMVFPVLLEPENSMWLLTLVNAFQIPVFLLLYRRQRARTAVSLAAANRRQPAWKKSFGVKELFLAALGGILLARGVNGLIGLTPLPRLFPAYETVSETLYQGSLLSQVMGSVVTASVLEETLMRGLIYERLRRIFSDLRPAVVAGALIFALFHGNVVQGAYAFFIGLYFVWLYEGYGSLLPAILAHAAANASSVLLEQTGWLDALYEDLPLYLALTALCLAAGAFCWSRVKLSRLGKKDRTGENAWKF